MPSRFPKISPQGPYNSTTKLMTEISLVLQKTDFTLSPPQTTQYGHTQLFTFGVSIKEIQSYLQTLFMAIPCCLQYAIILALF